MGLKKNGPHKNLLQIEIGIDKLEFLLSKGDLCAAEIRCLNAYSKKSLWSLCLASCSKRMQCNIFSFEAKTRSEQTTRKFCEKTSVCPVQQHICAPE